MKKLSQEKIDEIRRLKREGVSGRKIQKILGLSKSAVYKYTLTEKYVQVEKKVVPERLMQECDETRNKILELAGCKNE